MNAQDQFSEVKQAIRAGGPALEHMQAMMSHVFFEEMQRAGYPNQPDRIKEVSFIATKRFLQEWSTEPHKADPSVETENERLARVANEDRENREAQLESEKSEEKPGEAEGETSVKKDNSRKTK